MVPAIGLRGVGMTSQYSSSVTLQIGRTPWLSRLSVRLPQTSSDPLLSSSLAQDPLRVRCLLLGVNAPVSVLA